MKQLFYLLFAALFGMGTADASEPIDTLSYVDGYYLTLSSMAGENNFMRSMENFNEYIRGLEETFCKVTQLKDSSDTTVLGELQESAKQIESSYDMGKFIALTGTTFEKRGPSLHYPSFITGAKAFLGLGENLISRGRIEQIFMQQYFYNSEPVTYDDKLAELEEIDIEPHTPYHVDWSVTAATVANDKSPVSNTFHNLLKRIRIEDNPIPEVLMVRISDKDGRYYIAASEALRFYPLSKGYKWFCGRSNGTDTTIGIIETSPTFSARAHEAMVDYEFGTISIQWTYKDADAKKWARFTQANTGRHVALEINGIFMLAPRINSEISGADCCIDEAAPEIINLLFAKPE